MSHLEQLITSRWVPILKDYAAIKNKHPNRTYRYVKDLCKAHHLSKKELGRYYRKWVEGGRKAEAILPAKRGPRPGSRRTPKEIERNIIKAYRRFGSNRYELVALFKPYYLDKTPAPATMDRIKSRYPLTEKEKTVIRRYEMKAPGELAHIDMSEIPKDLRASLKIQKIYLAAICDDCTRLTYCEVLKDKKATTLSFFFARSLSWFKQMYGFEYSAVMSDNGPEFKGSLEKDHPFEVMCDQLGIKHKLTAPYRPQTNGKIEAFWRIVKNELFYPNKFKSMDDVFAGLGNYLFDYNHTRRHGGLDNISPFDKLQKVTELLI